ncbi:MTERF6, partial [Symbiodinium sp. KB8]
MIQKRSVLGSERGDAEAPKVPKEPSFFMHPLRRSRGYAGRCGRVLPGLLLALLLCASAPVPNLAPPAWWRRGFPRKRYGSFAEVELLAQLGALLRPETPLEEMFRSFPGKDLPEWGGHHLSPDLVLWGVLKDPEAALFIEYDGFYRHFEPRGVEADRRKTRALRAYAPAGSRVLRLSHEERELDDESDSLVISRWWPKHEESLTASLCEVARFSLGIPSLGLHPDRAGDLKRCLQDDFRLSEVASLFAGNATLAGDPNAKREELQAFLVSVGLSGSEVAKAVSRFPQLLGLSIGENLQPTVDWLKGLGLSDKAVAKAASRSPGLLGLSIGENLQPTVDWLKGLGLSDNKVAKAVSKSPQLLGYSIGENLQPTVEWLKGLSLSDNEVAKAVSTSPQLLGCSIGENLQPTVDWLKGLGLSDNAVAKAVSRHPNLLGHSVREKLQPTVEWLKGLGLSDKKVAKAVSRLPGLLGYSIGENLQPTVDWLKGLGLSDNEVAKAASKSPQLLGCSIGENLQPTVEWLKGLGWSGSEVAKAVSIYPQLLNCGSVSNSLEPMVSWFVCMGASTFDIKHIFLRFPIIMALSLSRNLRPKMQLLRQYFSLDDALSLVVGDPRIFSYSASRLHERLALLASKEQLGKFSAALRMTESIFESSYGVQTCKCLHWLRFKIIAQCLLAWGWDEFETFEVLMSVHSVQDIQNDGLFGKKEFKVKASFNWSNTETSGTQDMRWEQTKKLEIPQGAAEGIISLWSLGTIKDSKVASYSLDTKKDMLDKAESFFGKKQKLKLQYKGKTVGTLLITFRKRGKGEGDIGDCPIDGIDEDSPLLIDINNAIQEMVKKKELQPLQKGQKLDGERKIAVLAKTLQGDLREIDLEGKEKGKVYVRTIHCNFAELKGDDMKEEWAKQCEKARKKGLKYPQRKWYFAWYGSKNEATDPEKWHHPDGFFPLATMTAVHRSPERQDQFLVKYTAGAKETLVYRREQGKALDAWVEGLDLANQEIRENMKEEKEKEEMEEKEKAKAKMMHGQWMQKNGMPTNEEQWTAWFQWMKSGHLDEETIRNFYQ